MTPPRACARFGGGGKRLSRPIAWRANIAENDRGDEVKRVMKILDDEALLAHLNERRQEIVSAIVAGRSPPSDAQLEKLALVNHGIAAVEGAITERLADRA
jgi:hypothetical protein